MSWDIIVQDLPVGIRSVKEIPDGYQPKPIGTRAETTTKIREVCRQADFPEPTRGTIHGRDWWIEISLGEKDPLEYVALHVRGGDTAAGVVADIVKALGFPALDPGSDTGLFEPGPRSVESHQRWRAYRDQVVKGSRG